MQAAPRPGHTLTGKSAEAVWDEALTPTMREQSLTIAEEAMASVLLQDLDHR
ncbi:DUF2399 domain-containing protein [Lichenicoccus sp.]|uniref:DUF2399 domain-containing protein n=1 Tax=Lichenicoccus sp. TaxID=2781899 RepID=UPI003D14296D